MERVRFYSESLLSDTLTYINLVELESVVSKALSLCQIHLETVNTTDTSDRHERLND